MGAVKGRAMRRRGGSSVLYARVDQDVMDLLDAGASVAGWSLAAYLHELLSRMPHDARGIPPWLEDLVDEQGRLFEGAVRPAA
jgi:hypothetical protein